MRLSRAVLLVPCAALASCQALPDDHLLRAKLGKTTSALYEALDPREPIARAARRLGNLRETAVELLPWENGELRALGELPQTVAGLAQHEVAGVRHVRDTTADLVQHGAADLARLGAPDATWRVLASPERAAARTREAVDELPRALGLDRQILPSPTDRNRQTGIVYEVRQDTWIERLLRRIPRF